MESPNKNGTIIESPIDHEKIIQTPINTSTCDGHDVYDNCVLPTICRVCIAKIKDEVEFGLSTNKIQINNFRCIF